MSVITRSRKVAVALAAVALSAGLLSACSSSSSSSPSSSGNVLTVGSFHGKTGKYKTIQAAVDAAKPGDWILVGPGDYKESADLTGTPNTAHGDFGGVLIHTANIHIRGMSRSGVVVDGTKPGATSCSANQADQQFGAIVNGKPAGRNGILVYKANNVSIDNLTVCNFLGGGSDSGNGIWWNGGADTAKIGLSGYHGSYLTATSTYFGGNDTAAQYGIFSQDAAGNGATWTNIYASNMNDSGMYVGACQQVCGITIDKAWMEYSALGYSGTNSGGAIVVKNSLFDNNQDGFDTNTQINGDPPAPQNGACPNNGISPITHTHSCWVVMNNVFRDNNNPNVPKAGNAAAGPVGTGMTLSGGRNDTVMNNTFENNGAWGFLMVPFPDSSTPEYNQSCTGTGGVENAAFGCIYDPMNSKLAHNTFKNNGFFKNPSNGDYGQLVLNTNKPSNCFVGNVAPNGSAPPNLETLYPVCGVNRAAANTGGPLLAQVLCDTNFGVCPAGASYPALTKVVMHPLPTNLTSMPNPCAGVPDNAFCTGGKPI